MPRRGYPAVDRGCLYLSIQSQRPVAALFYQSARGGIPPFSFEGDGGGKKPESMGYGPYSHRRFGISEKKI
jgi:hypothetical protein